MNGQYLTILAPTFALVGLIFAVWFVLIRARLRHIRDNRPTASTFASAESVARYFQPIERPGHNLANLFELPMLYFALVPLLIQADRVTVAQVGLAWVFVALRLAHSLVHIGPNNILIRFRFYLASSIALSAMWLGFAFDLFAGNGARL